MSKKRFSLESAFPTWAQEPECDPGSVVWNFIRRYEGVKVDELLHLAEALRSKGEWVVDLPAEFVQLVLDFAEVFEGQTLLRSFEQPGELLWGMVGEQRALVIKPEPPHGPADGPTPKKEQIAFLLFPRRVPLTLWVHLASEDGVEEGAPFASVQRFLADARHLEPKERGALAAEEVQWIAHIDLVLGNRDRHGRNLLLNGEGHLIPIDHTYSLSSKWRPCQFAWLGMPAISQPIVESVRCDMGRAEEILLLLKEQKVDPSAIDDCERRLVLERVGAEAGLTYYELGWMLAGLADPGPFGATMRRSEYSNLVERSKGELNRFTDEAERLCQESARWKKRAAGVSDREMGGELLDQAHGFIGRMVELWLGQRHIYPRGMVQLNLVASQKIAAVEPSLLLRELTRAFGRNVVRPAWGRIRHLVRKVPPPELIEELGRRFSLSTEPIAEQQLRGLGEFVESRPEWASAISPHLLQFVDDFVHLDSIVAADYNPARDVYYGMCRGERQFVFKPHLSWKEQEAVLPLGRGGVARLMSRAQQVRFEQIAHHLFPERAPIALWMALSNRPPITTGVRHCAVQRYVEGRSVADLSFEEVQELAPGEVQWIAHIDLLLGHSDRHEGNVILTPEGRLMAIDHGMVFAPRVDVGVNFWTRHPAIRRPVDPQLAREIKARDPSDLIALLHHFGIIGKSADSLLVRAILEQEGVAVGLNLFDVAAMLWKYSVHRERRCEAVDLVERTRGQLGTEVGMGGPLFSERFRAVVKERVAQIAALKEGNSTPDDPFLLHLEAMWHRWPLTTK